MARKKKPKVLTPEQQQAANEERGRALRDIVEHKRREKWLEELEQRRTNRSGPPMEDLDDEA